MFSRGSVLPLFIEQIQRGVPLTVTHPDMTRFLLPLAEAIDLVLHALKDGGNGDLFIRKATAATVGDLAQACLDLMGAKNPFETIGIRAGEKMHETLATAEELARSEDQGDYWRIPCEHGHHFERYFTDGVPKAAEIEPFTSENAERLGVSRVVELLTQLPEFQRIHRTA
jgi:UDP-glucose 4-epimerase